MQRLLRWWKLFSVMEVNLCEPASSWLISWMSFLEGFQPWFKGCDWWWSFFGKLFRKSITLFANKLREISDLRFPALLSGCWNTSQVKHVMLMYLTSPSITSIPCPKDSLSSFHQLSLPWDRIGVYDVLIELTFAKEFSPTWMGSCWAPCLSSCNGQPGKYSKARGTPEQARYPVHWQLDRSTPDSSSCLKSLKVFIYELRATVANK